MIRSSQDWLMSSMQVSTSLAAMVSCAFLPPGSTLHSTPRSSWPIEKSIAPAIGVVVAHLAVDLDRLGPAQVRQELLVDVAGRALEPGGAELGPQRGVLELTDLAERLDVSWPGPG